jgi:hypothetical protein
LVGRFFRESLFQIVVGLAVTGTITVFALINKYWNWPNAVVGGVLLLCGMFYLMEKLGIGPSTKTRVRDWLDSSSFGVQTIQDTNEFHFILTDNIGMKASILQVKASAPIMIISPGHAGTPEQVTAFKSLTKPQQDAFWKSVRLELLKYGIQFSDRSWRALFPHSSASACAFPVSQEHEHAHSSP